MNPLNPDYIAGRLTAALFVSEASSDSCTFVLTFSEHLIKPLLVVGTDRAYRQHITTTATIIK